jgi:hypothetical protein
MRYSISFYGNFHGVIDVEADDKESAKILAEQTISCNLVEVSGNNLSLNIDEPIEEK